MTDRAWTPPGFVPDSADWRPEGFVADGGVPPEATAFLRSQDARGMERRWLRAAPFAGGAAGGTFFGFPGATMGGMAGKVLEQGVSHELPRSPKEAVRSIGGAGIEQGGLQAGGEFLGFLGGKLAGAARGGAAALEARAGRMAGEKAEKVLAARDVTKDVAAALPGLEQNRAASGDELVQYLRSVDAEGSKPITAKEIADRIVAKQVARFPEKADPSYRSYMRRIVRRRIDQVLKEYSLGALKPTAAPKPSAIVDQFGAATPAVAPAPSQWNLNEANFAKQSFQTNSKPELGAASRGVAHKPGLDRAISGAFKSAIEERAPESAAINARTKAIIQDIQGVRRLDNTNHSPTAAGIRRASTIRGASTAAMTPGPSELASVHLGPLPGVHLKPPALSSFLRGTASTAESPFLTVPVGHGIPRAALLWRDLATDSPFLFAPRDTEEVSR